eukprot:1551104-Pleurochrysis_carterae.AAC.1
MQGQGVKWARLTRDSGVVSSPQTAQQLFSPGTFHDPGNHQACKLQGSDHVNEQGVADLASWHVRFRTENHKPTYAPESAGPSLLTLVCACLRAARPAINVVSLNAMKNAL